MVIPVVLGGQGWSLSVLPIRANREWVALFNEQVRGKLNAVGPLESADQLADLIVASAETMMDLLIDYDRIGAKAWEQDPVLPEREWIDTHATDGEVYRAIKLVTAAAFPPGVDLRTLIPDLMPLLMESLSRGLAVGMVALSRSTSSAPPSTAGRRQKSSAA